MLPLSPAVVALQQASTTNEVEFNCPWCNTRLALTRADFEKERAVLCPRCSNPIDLDIQRRLAQTTTVSKPQAPATPAPKFQKSATPAPRVERAPIASRYSARPEPPLKDTAPEREAPAPPAKPIGLIPDVSPQKGFEGLSDWNQPINIDANFRTTIRPAAPTGPASPSKGASHASPYGGKIICPACNYENPKVPPEFSFGAVAKCAWCGKPLPEA